MAFSNKRYIRLRTCPLVLGAIPYRMRFDAVRVTAKDNLVNVWPKLFEDIENPTAP
jgi:hypothetical protein